MGLLDLEPGVVLKHPTKGIGIYLGKHLIFYTIYKYTKGGSIEYTSALVDELLTSPAWLGYTECIYHKDLDACKVLELQANLNTHFRTHNYMKGKCLLGEYECVAYIVYPHSSAQEIVYRIDMVKNLKRKDFDGILATSEAEYRGRIGLAKVSTAMDLFLHSELVKSSHFNRGLNLVISGLAYGTIENCYNIIETEYGLYPILYGERVALKYYNLNFRNRIKFPMPESVMGSFVPLQV